MFRTKKDVDRHVQELFRKLKGEKERKSKYFNIGRLYFQVGDYEAARKYASAFISIRDDSAAAHKLLGQALEALGQKENALTEFKCSLMLESNQSDLVLKVCELMADPGVKIDKSTAKYWSERADQLYPHHTSIFKLKEKMVSSDDNHNATELEKLVLSELATRPKDVSLHIRLLQLHLEAGRINDAYIAAVEVEMRFAFREELKWYECLIEVFKAYANITKPCGWEFFFHYVGVLERAACLNLQEQYGTPRRTWAQTVNALFNFDQILEVASGQSSPSSEVSIFQEFLKHMRAQLCLHFATALFKKAKKEPSTWVDLSKPVARLLLLALVPPVDIHAGWVTQTAKSRRKCIEWWGKEAAYRNSQAGHLLQNLVTDRRSHFLERVTQFCTANWRDRLFQKIFNTRDHHQAIGSSHFVAHQGFTSPTLHIPSNSELRPYDEMAQHVFPNSLHHMVWLGLRELSACSKRGGSARLGADFHCLVFENLQFSCSNLNSAGSETLCQLDIDAFLYASVLCAKASLDEEQAAGYRSNEKPQTFPANITDYLCTITQAKWWTAAYKVYTNQARGDLGEIRQILQRGVEVVRVLGNHGLDVCLIVQLARIFSERASVMASQSCAPSDIVEVESRAALYWTSALPLLDKLQRSQTVRAPHTRLFEYQSKELSMAEINTLLEEGRYFLALQMMKEDKLEKALESFQQLKSPYASFHQATIYKKLAAQELEDQQGELITSEMRSRHIILLTKVRECLYLTLDRLRTPGVDRKHPLNAELSSHIEEIESQLARIDPDMWRGDVNRNDLDAVSDGSISSDPSGGENGNSFGYTSSFVHLTPRHLNSTRMSSTPYRHNHNHSHRLDSDTFGHENSRRQEARPSPERLEAQIRHLMHGRDAQMQQVIQQNKALLESHRTVAHSLDELKNLIQEFIKELKKDVHKRSESQLNSDLPHVGDPDDDLYVFDEEYSEDVNISTGHLGQYQAFPTQYPSYAGPGYRQVSGMIGSSTMSYGPPQATAESTGAVPPPQLLPPAPGMSSFFRNVDPSMIYPQTLGYYGQGALPFSEGQQLPDFRAAAPTAPAGSVFSRLGPPPVPGSDVTAMHQSTKVAPPPQPAPVNVVITSSDTLPTTVPPTQPTLSVTIPPQHLLGTPLVHATVPPSVPGAIAQSTGVTPGVPPGIPPGIPQGMPPVIPPGVPSLPPGVSSGVPPPVAPCPPAGGISFPAMPGVPAGPGTSALPGQLKVATGVPATVPSVTATSSTAVPHAFQISMPPQAQVPVASRLEKGAAALSPVLPISTQTLLSSVPSPVYSAVGFDKSGKDQPGTPATSTTVSSSGPGTPSTPMGTKVAVISPTKPTKAHRLSTGSVVESEVAAVEEVEHDPCPDFQPVIPLPAEVELTTGEEQEAVLYECRCKLFRFVEKEWKERGVGQLKLLHHKETGKVRLLMRREQVLKVCANHFLTPDMSLTKMMEKAWIWVANDFADEEVRLEKLCARFKTVDDASNFVAAFNNACELSRNAKTTPVKDFSKAADVLITSGKTVAMTTSLEQVSTSSTPVAAPGLVVVSSPSEKIVVGGFTFSSPPKFTSTGSSKTNIEKDSIKEKDKLSVGKSSPFAQFSFTSRASDTPILTSASTFSGSLAKPVFSTAFSTSSSISSTNTDKEQGFTLRRPTLSSLISSASPAVETVQKDQQPEDFAGGGEPLMFKATNLTTFSSLASNASDKAVFQKTATFKGFEKAGTPLFSKSSLGEGKKKEKENTLSPKVSGGDDESEEFVPTQEFTPVIALPKLVEIKTGEEGQEVVFQERAKLLRYDSDRKEWKERGMGTMKILKDPPTGSVRLLMRRDQVLKVCCNHMLTKSISFNVLQSCDKAWSWIAEDYSEGEVKGELFALRFKTIEQARAFGAKITELQSCMVNDKVPVSTDVVPVSPSLGVSSFSTSAVDAAKTVSDEWKCNKCLTSNSGGTKACKSCSALKSFPSQVLCTPPPLEGDKMKLSEMFKAPAGSWECTVCYTRNSSNAEYCVCCQEKRTIRSPPKAVLEQFKPKQGSWECKNCYSRNEEDNRTCSSCDSEKHASTPTKQNGPSPLVPLSEMFKPKADSWECKHCYVVNTKDAIECIACTNPKPGCEEKVKEEKKTDLMTSGFSFGSGQTTGFTFGIPKQEQQESTEKTKPGISSATTGFTFGSATTSLDFGAPNTQPPFSTNSTQNFSVFGSTSQPLSTSKTLSTSDATSQPVFGSWTFGANTSAPASSTCVTPTTSNGAKTQSSVVSSTTSSKAESEKQFSFDAKKFDAFQFGTLSPATSKTFNFGVKDETEQKDTEEAGPRNFVFGSPESFEFNFSGIRPKSPVKSPKSPGVIGASGGEDDSGSEPEEDEGEHIYFQPAVPLPDKVPLHTGEEEEDVLYCNRAKLYRFVNGEWKERGLGDIKVLKHKQSRQVRLLMRREQVLKLCLNHFVTTDMIFTEKDEKSWFWIAADFAEGEIKQEKLAIRFKNKDSAIGFKKAIDEAKTDIGVPSPKKTDFTSSSSAVSTSEKKKSSDGVVRSLFGESSPLSTSAGALDLSKSDDDLQVVYELTVTSEEKAAAEKLMLPPNFFSYKRHPPCSGCCGCEPDSDSEDSKSCLLPVSKSSIEDAAQKSNRSQTDFSTSSASPAFSSSCALPPTTLPSSLVFSSTSIPSTTVSLGSFSSTSSVASNIFGKGLTFGNSQTQSPILSSPATSAPTTPPTAPPTTPTVTSASSIVFSSFSFSPSENKDIKPFSAGSGGPLFGGAPSSTQSSIFGKVPITTSTSSVFSQSSTTSIFGSNITSAPLALGKTSTSTTTTPSTIFPQGSQSTCIFGQGTQTTTTVGFGPFLFGQSGSKSPSFGQTAAIDGKPPGAIFGSPLTTTASATPVFGMNVQNIPSSTLTVTSSVTSSQLSVQSNSQPDRPFVFNVTSTPPSDDKAVGEKLEKKDEKTEESKEQTEETVPFLPVDSNLTFTLLASQSKEDAFATDKNFTWAGAGGKVFGAESKGNSEVDGSFVKKPPKSTGDGSSDEETDAAGREDNPDPHFEPIVALPDTIEVRTGEEDEEKVFGQRAKLYRYEADLHQWKERGVGEMKILKHPGHGTYRLLMRRDQVHKVVLNQLVTADIELSPLAGSDVSWCWGGINFAEDDTSGEVKTEPKPEKLAVRFKDHELAKQFADCVQQCLKELKSRPATSTEFEVESVQGKLLTRRKEEEEEEENVSDEHEKEDETDNEEDEEEEEEEDEDDEDDDDIDDDDDDIQRNLMFEKRTTLEACGSDKVWETQGMGSLQIVYDPDCSLARVYMQADSEDILCNTVILHNTDIKVHNKDCVWTGLDESLDPPDTRTFKTRFSSASSAEQFATIFAEGSEIAQQNEIPESTELES